ncbi:MAG: hypothetical protein WC325_13865 [Candidatus Bathyarchaeia archaeon]
MIYECQKCKKQFHLATKQIIQETPTTYLNFDATYANEHPQKTVTITTEAYVCPHCGSKEFNEYKEPQLAENKLENIISLKDVAPNDADTWLSQGYVVLQTWQKNVFVAKYKPNGANLQETK